MPGVIRRKRSPGRRWPSPLSAAYRGFRRVLLAVLAALLYAPALLAQPGAIVTVEFDRSYSAAEVDAATASLFSGYDRPSARTAVEVYWLRYESRYSDGSRSVVTSQLFLPRSQAGTGDADSRGGEGPRDLYLFGPGSTGILDVCRPSREHTAGIYWGSYRAHTLAFAGQGMVGLLPDYMGFGDPNRLQPFFHEEAGAHLMLDGVRATRAFLRRAGRSGIDRVFLAGYSQGGHAAFAAADYREQYAPDVAIDGIIGYGPTTDMHALIREFVVVGPVVAYTFRNRYGVDRFDPALMLQERWLERLDHDVTRQCIGGLQSYYPWNPYELYREEFVEPLMAGELGGAFPEIDAILREQSTGLSGHRVPALILQGTDDIVVYPETQTAFVTRLRQAGSEVRYYIYEDERHDVRQAAHLDVLAWIEEKE